MYVCRYKVRPCKFAHPIDFAVWIWAFNVSCWDLVILNDPKASSKTEMRERLLFNYVLPLLWLWQRPWIFKVSWSAPFWIWTIKSDIYELPRKSSSLMGASKWSMHNGHKSGQKIQKSALFSTYLPNLEALCMNLHTWAIGPLRQLPQQPAPIENNFF